MKSKLTETASSLYNDAEVQRRDRLKLENYAVELSLLEEEVKINEAFGRNDWLPQP